MVKSYKEMLADLEQLTTRANEMGGMDPEDQVLVDRCRNRIHRAIAEEQKPLPPPGGS